MKYILYPTLSDLLVLDLFFISHFTLLKSHLLK